MRNNPRHKVLLRPEGITMDVLRARGVAGRTVQSAGLPLRHRLAIELYGNKRGT